MRKEDIAIPADPDDPDVTYEALETGLRGRAIRIARTTLGLTQVQFA